MNRTLDNGDKTARAIHQWAKTKRSQGDAVDGVIWTAIPSNINRPFVNNAIRFIGALEDKSEAEDYVRRTPVEVVTPFGGLWKKSMDGPR